MGPFYFDMAQFMLQHNSCCIRGFFYKNALCILTSS